MAKIPVKIKKLHPDAQIPTYGTDEAACFDFYALERTEILAKTKVLVRTGIAMELPVGFEVQVRPRSGVSLKKTLRIPNAPGTIDSDYRGECFVMMENYGDSVAPIIIEKGDRIAQGKISEVPIADFTEVDTLDTSKRGAGGFGSTGQ